MPRKVCFIKTIFCIVIPSLSTFVNEIFIKKGEQKWKRQYFLPARGLSEHCTAPPSYMLVGTDVAMSFFLCALLYIR